MSTADPGNLGNLDQELRLNNLRDQVAETVGAPIEHFEAADAPPEVLEQFWKKVLAVEDGPWTTDREQLAEDGYFPLAPEDIAEADLSDALADLITKLAARGTYVFNTDHLSDRELYRSLWDNTLDEEHPQMPCVGEGDCGWFVDMVGSGSEDDTRLYLTYYADEQARDEWRREWPDDPVPDHVDPPFDRDRFLPRPAEDM